MAGARMEIKFDSIQVNDKQVHFAFAENDNDTLLAFVHGSPGSWNAFIEYFKIDSLFDQMDMVSVDRPGYGNSEFGMPEYSVEEQASQIHQAFEQFSHGTKILIGHSMGGGIVARMAMDYPESYHKLVLLAPTLDPDLEGEEWYNTLAKTRVGGALIPTEMWVSNEEIMALSAELELMLDLWPQVTCEIVMMHGTKDWIVPFENVDFIRAQVADSLLTIIEMEGVNHFIPFTHIEEVVEVLQGVAVNRSM